MPLSSLGSGNMDSGLQHWSGWVPSPDSLRACIVKDLHPGRPPQGCCGNSATFGIDGHLSDTCRTGTLPKGHAVVALKDFGDDVDEEDDDEDAGVLPSVVVILGAVCAM